MWINFFTICGPLFDNKCGPFFGWHLHILIVFYIIDIKKRSRMIPLLILNISCLWFPRQCLLNYISLILFDKIDTTSITLSKVKSPIYLFSLRYIPHKDLSYESSFMSRLFPYSLSLSPDFLFCLKFFLLLL